MKPGAGAKWILDNYGDTLYNHADGPNPSLPDCTNMTQQKGRMAARGNHPGVVAVGIDPVVWRAIGTRAG